jgi:hypothetical protein
VFPGTSLWRYRNHSRGGGALVFLNPREKSSAADQLTAAEAYRRYGDAAAHAAGDGSRNVSFGNVEDIRDFAEGE